jgi:hypothetical protein
MIARLVEPRLDFHRQPVFGAVAAAVADNMVGYAVCNAPGNTAIVLYV